MTKVVREPDCFYVIRHGHHFRQVASFQNNSMRCENETRSFLVIVIFVNQATL